MSFRILITFIWKHLHNCRGSLSGSADQRWMALPRRSRGQTRTTRGVNDPPRRATGASRARAVPVMLGHPWLPTDVSTRAPVIHPVRVHKYPWQASQCGMGSIPCRMYDVCRKKAGSLLGALRQNLSRLRVEKIGCLISTCGSSCPGSIYPLAQRSIRPHPQMNGRRVQSDCRDHPLCAV